MTMTPIERQAKTFRQIWADYRQNWHMHLHPEPCPTSTDEEFEQHGEFYSAESMAAYHLTAAQRNRVMLRNIVAAMRRLKLQARIRSGQ